MTMPAAVLYAITAFLSASLLFIIQPLTARLVLPMLGGSATVWTTTLLFFQFVLLLGYAWAHLSNRLSQRAQILAQSMLLAAGAWLLPASVVSIQLTDEPSVGALFRVLLVLVGVPAFAVAVNGSLLQRWFTGANTPRAHDPTFLYAYSNAGSFAGAIAYPLIVEPVFTLTTQRALWGLGCGIVALLVALCGVQVRRVTGALPDVSASPPTQRARLQWLVLALVPSSLLAGVTAYLSTELLPMPLLWVVPLCVYLLTFVVSFSGHVLQPDARFLPLLPIATTGIVVWNAWGGAALGPSLTLHLVVFTVIAALCHGRLRNTRPDPSHLTEYYWWIALGGVLGTALNALVAPVVFTTPAEYPLMLVGAAVVVWRFAEGRFTGARGGAFVALVGVTALWVVRSSEPAPAVAMIPVLLLLASYAMRPGAAVLIACILAVAIGHDMVAGAKRQVATVRSVFAALRVVDDWHPDTRALVHGSTVHGLQARDPRARREPRSYYGREGPVGQLIEAIAPRLAGARIGVIGLGVGELAAYARDGQRWTFYEIDREVVRLAESPGVFTYLSDAQGDMRIVVGDGRIAISQDIAGGPFDLLILDAFTSDAVPVHLLTLEALETYSARLAPAGTIAVHISNRFVDLRRVLAAAAPRLGMSGRWQNDAGRAGHRYPSQWAVMSYAHDVPERLDRTGRWQPLDLVDPKVLWTDERATLFHVIR